MLFGIGVLRVNMYNDPGALGSFDPKKEGWHDDCV